MLKILQNALQRTEYQNLDKNMKTCCVCKIPVKCGEDGKCFRQLEEEFLKRKSDPIVQNKK